ncbi:MAG: LysM domain-containing protein [Pseudomonadota bacterium]
MQPILRPILATMFLLTMAAGPARADDEPDIVSTYPSITGERIYIVEQGDTLWDISDLFFDDPHFWPTLWAFNPQITNPHWIYPGDYVVLFPKTLTEGGAAIVWSQSRYTEKPKDIQIEARSKGFISDRKFKESGKIIFSREERDYLAQYDEIYVEFYIPKKIKAGEEFTIYRKEGDVRHPVDDKIAGYQVRHLGVAKVLGVEKRFVKALLLKTYEEIQRGDMLTDIFTHQFRVQPKVNRTRIEGIILSAFEEVGNLGENEYVFLDKGRQDGVEAGNRFVVTEKGDGRKGHGVAARSDVAAERNALDFGEDEDAPLRPPPRDDQMDLPWEVIGEIMVIEPYDNTSLGVITRSIKELEIGQRCVMRKGYGAQETNSD